MRLRQSSAKKSKVKVQYEENHEGVTTEDVQNVEYLEECHLVDDGIAMESSTFVDTFYPNAIHCLISMYHNQYERLQRDKTLQVSKLASKIWNEISKDMRDCYFDFDAFQVQQKFMQLRQKYFSISTKQEASEFEYFQPLHAIYKEKFITAVLDGRTETIDKLTQLQVHRDDALFATLSNEEHIHEENQCEIEPCSAETNPLEIPHKEDHALTIEEHEYLSLESEDAVKAEKNSFSDITGKEDSRELAEKFVPGAKRFKLNSDASDIRQKTQEQVSEKTLDAALSPISFTATNDMTLAAYNDAQQERHEEKMALMRHSLILQENAIEIQRQLIEQLIKRLK